ncbi:hypothetical protein [Streptomyces sp. NPDC047009]|uniref:hypothetical protein n=1 Tax=Streptomyces sp. NPDC047009 TaxID=3154496 RepID=UPI0033C0A939
MVQGVKVERATVRTTVRIDHGTARRPDPPNVFLGTLGGVLRRNNFRRIRLRALAATGLGGVRFHDLRHTGNTLAATGGATTRELTHRMGHSSVRAALVCQHLVNGRDHRIADYVDGQIKGVKRPPARSIWHVSGTTAPNSQERSRPRSPGIPR